MVGVEFLKAHEAYYRGDTRGWQQQARLLQSLWRQARGLPPRGGGDHDGSYLPDSEAKDKTGAAYISQDALAALKSALKDKEPGAVLQKKRLWCNLLSSQPLCFNLFGALSEHVDDPRTTQALKAVWPDIGQVTRIRYEHSPGRGPGQYLGNRTAFDVCVDYVDDAGSARFLGIEVKYHEDLSGKAPKVRAEALDVLRTSQVFAPTAEKALTTGRKAQLLLDHLLALSINVHVERHGRFIILFPESNSSVRKHGTQYLEHLATDDDSFQPLTIEEFVSTLRTVLDDPWLDEIQTRYLDTAAIHRLEPFSG